MSAYNYETFPLDMEAAEFTAFRQVLQPGTRAPKGTLYDLATGEAVKLHRVWRKGPLMLEFGSYS